jgi:aspartyl-tRNA(Asn)/glutamyl-tRNA(Gln) amidotransferase subunit A
VALACTKAGKPKDCSIPVMAAADLTDAAQRIERGQDSASALIEAALARADEPALRHTYLRRFDAEARSAAEAVDAARAAGRPLFPLAGLAVSVKDLFDVAGHPTTAASRSLHDAPPARADATAVARLRAAGAALTGHTNMTEFAYSGIGLNRAFGTPANPVAAALDPRTPRIPGGSTSGGAVSVAGGAAWAALGSDTGGSIRIPAALQGLVGFKSTARLVPADGCIPLATSLDTVCAITRSVRDAVRVHGVLAARTPQPDARPLPAVRFAVPRTLLLDGLDHAVAAAFERAIGRLRASGAQVAEIDLPWLRDVGAVQAALASAEAWGWHRARLAEREAAYDPRVALRIRRGEKTGAAELAALHAQRAALIAGFVRDTAGIDALLSPTVPVVAPPMPALEHDDDAFFALNTLLLRNPSVVNLLDGCAISLPCHEPGGWPVGLMLWAPALADDRVLGAALAVEAALAREG